MGVITLTVPVPPISNHRLKFGGHYYTTKESKQYQEIVRGICAGKKIRPFKGDVRVVLTWYRARKSGDLMERFKDLYDALEAKKNYGFGPYVDDKQISVEQKTRDDSDPKHPRIELEIHGL